RRDCNISPRFSIFVFRISFSPGRPRFVFLPGSWVSLLCALCASALGFSFFLIADNLPAALNYFHEPFHPPPRPRRRHPRRPAASRRTHASPHPRRIHRPGKTSRPRQTPSPPDRVRQSQLHAFLGPPGLRQNHSRPRHRPPYPQRVHLLQRRPQRHQGNQRRHGPGRAQIPLLTAHHRLRRRSASLQQSSAGRLPPSRRSRPHPLHRRHHRKSFLRGHLPAPLPHQGLRPRSPHHPANRRSPPPRPCRSRTRPCQHSSRCHRRRSLPHRRLFQWRRPHRLQHPRTLRPQRQARRSLFQ